MKEFIRIEEELNAIRIKLYEQTKGMTPDEEVAYLKKMSAAARKGFAIQTIGESNGEAPKISPYGH